jgi:hypothetical protein
MTKTLLVDRWGSPQASLLEATGLRMILNMRKPAADWPCWLLHLVSGHPAFLAYLRRVNDRSSTPRNPQEIMYLPPVDSS